MLENLAMIEDDECWLKQQEWQGVRQVPSKVGQELTPLSWQKFEDVKCFTAVILDSLTHASNCQR